MRSVPTFVLLLAAPLQAEWNLSALTEGQVGNLPGAQPSDLRTIYHQFSLDYALADFRIGVRGETFGTSADSRNYGQLLQRSASYRRSGFEATIGNFYTIVGSGLLLHAFELPGVITEVRGSRRRYQIVRDLDGVQVRYRAKRAEVLLLRGAPINSACRPVWRGLTADQTRSTLARSSSSRTRTSTLVLAPSATQPAGGKKRARPSMPAGGLSLCWRASASPECMPISRVSTPSAMWRSIASFRSTAIWAVPCIWRLPWRLGRGA